MRSAPHSNPIVDKREIIFCRYKEICGGAFTRNTSFSNANLIDADQRQAYKAPISRCPYPISSAIVGVGTILETLPSRGAK
jgi:hypothetical protein